MLTANYDGKPSVQVSLIIGWNDNHVIAVFPPEGILSISFR